MESWNGGISGDERRWHQVEATVVQGAGTHDGGYQGLLLDFYGVLTSDLFQAYRAFCGAQALAPDALLHLLLDDPDGG